MRAHHIGIVCKNIDKAMSVYSWMGYHPIGEAVVDDIQHNKLLFLQNADGELLELIEPLGEGSTVKNCKEGYHHICYEMDDIDETIREINANRLGSVFSRPVSAPAFENRRIVFAYMNTHTIVEFLEKRRD